MKSLKKSFALFAVAVFSFSLHAEEFLIERQSDVYSLASMPATSELKILRSFQAFGKTYDVVEAPSENSFKKPSIAAFSKSVWRVPERNREYKLLAGAKPPSKPDDLSDFTPKPVVPNDEFFPQLWAMLNYGQTIVTKGKRKMDAAVGQAWTLHKGSRQIVVGIMDTGVDYNHPDLKENLWTRTVNGKLSYGYDAFSNDADPMDAHRHGTHVAGTIGAVGNNGIGVAGVNWSTRMAAIQIFNAKGVTRADAILSGLSWIYDRRNEIRVVNHSWGGQGYSRSLHEAFDKLDEAGILNVFAAGNEDVKLLREDVGRDKGFYPAMFPLNSSIVVASFTNQGTKSSFSNYGPEIVDLSAPGSDIESTVPGGKYESLSGTSMAAPHVTGAVALLMSYRPELSAAQVKKTLLESADETASLTSTSYRGRRLNVYRALSGN